MAQAEKSSFRGLLGSAKNSVFTSVCAKVGGNERRGYEIVETRSRNEDLALILRRGKTRKGPIIVPIASPYKYLKKF